MDVSESSNQNIAENVANEILEETEKFDENDEVDPEEWELVDEDFVTIDLIGLLNEDAVKSCQRNNLKLIGMFDENPVLQIGKTWFVGTREEIPGTNVIFQVEGNTDQCSSDEEDPISESEKIPLPKMQLRCKTRKKLVMRQAFLKKKPVLEDKPA